jgi:hypothetical protein
MSTLRFHRSSVLRCLLSSVAMLLATAGFAQAPDAASKPAEDKTTDDQAARERKFEESMRNVSMVGFFTASDQPAGKLSEDRYVIDKVVKDKGDIWIFHARIQYGKHDTPVRLPVPVKWAGDTPVISVTKMAIPLMGTFNARVLIYDGHYAGTWDGAGHGGQMFGRIEKNKEAEQKEGEKKPAE